jgi:hypothetical protein
MAVFHIEFKQIWITVWSKQNVYAFV